jgi:hypothetical protein
MKTLGIILLVLLALFFGGCTLTALVFSGLDTTMFPLIALGAGVLCVACIFGIRALRKDKGPVQAPDAPDSGEDGTR